MSGNTLRLIAAAIALLATPCHAAQRFPATGLVISTDPAKQTITISHDAIPGYMDAMAMPFRSADVAVLKTVAPGATVAFTLVVDRGSSWIENLRVVEFRSAERDPEQARRLALVESIIGRSQVNRIAVGGKVPDFTLTDQNNHPVTLSQFAGKVVALNFVYTRCPLPDYCFRLSNNLSQVQKRFPAKMGRDLILLTITFDPAHDTPAVMANYAHIWNSGGSDSAHSGWFFLTGDPAGVQRVCGMFGVAAWQDEGILTHTLHTVVIDRRGMLAANLEGNTFTAKQLGDLVDKILIN